LSHVGVVVGVHGAGEAQQLLRVLGAGARAQGRQGHPVAGAVHLRAPRREPGLGHGGQVRRRARGGVRVAGCQVGWEVPAVSTQHVRGGVDSLGLEARGQVVAGDRAAGGHGAHGTHGAHGAHGTQVTSPVQPQPQTQPHCLGVEVPPQAALRHRLLADDVVDAEHAARLPLADPGGGLVVMQHGRMRGCGVQLRAVTRAHPGVQGVRVRGPAHRGRGERAGALHVAGVGAHIRAFESFPPPQEAPVVKHVLGSRVQGPVVALTRPTGLPGDLHEAVVKGEVVADGVLPFLGVLPVERKALHDELINAPQGELPLGRVGDGHGDERDVAVGGLPPLDGPLPPAAPGGQVLVGLSRRGSILRVRAAAPGLRLDQNVVLGPGLQRQRRRRVQARSWRHDDGTRVGGRVLRLGGGHVAHAREVRIICQIHKK